MISDESEDIRMLGYRRIIYARESSNTHDGLRKFRVPSLFFNAEHYTEMIDWSKEDRTEPPLTKVISTEDLKLCIKDRNIPRLDYLLKFPCHIQSVERYICLVTSASMAVCGEDNRDDCIRSVIQSRSMMKTFNTKSGFKI